ncbi:MAG: zinc metalloprotease HtpX [Bacillota bacterium]|nr:zinc metalloprotease HtpX [Bacillota bacterium]
MERRLSHDWGLSARMFLTLFLLAALYLAFTLVLWNAGVDFFSLVVIVGGMMALQYFLSDRLVLWSMGAREVSEAEAPELHAMVERLAATADLPKPRVAIARTDVPNAFATGRNPSHAVVAVTTGLLNRLEPEEVEAVLGHELTHVRNRDVAVITWASFFATIASFIVQRFYLIGWMAGGRDERNNNSGVAWVVVYLVSLLVWVISFFLIRALSRYRELAADRGSAILTGAPSRLASALQKISGRMQMIPTRDLRQAEAFNAFFIVPALSGESVMELFSTHPSLKRRLEQLERLQRELEGRPR